MRLDDRRFHARKDVVQLDYLSPVGCPRMAGLGVYRRDGCLEGVWPKPARHQHPLHERRPFRDLLPVPERAILVLEQHQIAC